MTEQLAPQYQPGQIEQDLYRWWMARGLFAPRSGGRPYVIMMPPPNVTANLHMGHGLNNTIQDAVIRFERMRGRETLWLPGTDHAGIATQNVVERALAAEGKTRFDLGREAFVARVWEHVHETGATILDQLKAIGASCDWGRTYFTLDEGLSRAVREVFVQLYDKGLIYRGNYIINWCPRCLTALSNEEAEKEEQDGHLWHLRVSAGRRRLPHRGHHPPRDDAGRHRRGRASRRHPVRAPDRHDGAAAARRARHPDRRRRRDRPGVRHRRRQGDAGPRPARLRDRPPARTRLDRHPDPRRPPQRKRAGAVPRAHARGRPQAGGARVRGARASSTRSSRTATPWRTATAAAPWWSRACRSSGS